MIGMNKNNIIDILKKYNFDNSKYLVISGAAMVLYGIKDSTNDIDIAVTKDYYNYLLSNYNCIFERVNEYGNSCYMMDNCINFGINYYSDNKEFIESIPVQSIEDLLQLKKYLNRDKDIFDIEKIKRYIKENYE